MLEPSEIKSIRKALGWTQKQLAAHLGVTNISVYKWEKGIAKPHPTFNMKIEELRDGSRPEA